MGVAARQGEVSHIHHGAVKVSCENVPPRVRQKLATSNLVYSQRKARAAGAVEVTGRFPQFQAHFNAINNHNNHYLMQLMGSVRMLIFIWFVPSHLMTDQRLLAHVMETRPAELTTMDRLIDKKAAADVQRAGL